MFKCHKYWYTVKDNYSHKRMIMALAAVAIYFMWIMPVQLYAFDVIDRHYFGWFGVREPLVAATTKQAGYYTMHGIPYIDQSQLEMEHTKYQLGVLAGRDPYEAKREEFSFSRVAHRFLQRMKGASSTGQNNDYVTPANTPLTQLLKDKHKPEGHRELQSGTQTTTSTTTAGGAATDANTTNANATAANNDDGLL